MEAQTAAVDCRNLRETDEVSGTLLAKAASGGYSLTMGCSCPVSPGRTT